MILREKDLSDYPERVLCEGMLGREDEELILAWMVMVSLEME